MNEPMRGESHLTVDARANPRGSENEAGEDDAARTAINMAGSPTFFTLDIYLTT